MTADDCLSQRFNALAHHDYAIVYASYHQDSPFLQQFADRAAYLLFAQQQLRGIVVKKWQSLRKRTLAEDRQEHLLVMELSVDGVCQSFYELALLIRTADGWRYHSAQKISPEDYSGAPEDIQFAHFDQVSQKICY